MKVENIKFKAKELGTGEWKEGFLQRDMDYNLCILVAKKEEHSWYWTQIDPSTVCQFTGLKDCEDKEVWEGDILLNTNSGSQYTVMYSDYGGAFFIRKKGTANDDMYLFELSDVDKCIAFLEVIGNKFDK